MATPTGESPDAARQRRAAERAEQQHQLALQRSARAAKRTELAKDRRATRTRNTPPVTERTFIGRAEHAGPLKFGDLLLGVGIGALSGLWTATRSHATGDDLYWATGSTLLGIVVAAGAREGTEVEYGSYAVAAVNGAYLLLRLTGGVTTGG